MIKNIILTTLSILLLLPQLSLGKEPIRSLDGIVIKVADGDTITVNSAGTKLKVRLYGIDTPETEKINRRTGIVFKEGQPYGEEAWRSLEGKVAGQKVHLDIMDVDRYSRIVSMVWIGSRNINQEMVTGGWAWAYRKYLNGPYASEFVQGEERARKKRLGLWKQHNPQPPWEFRKLQRD